MANSNKFEIDREIHEPARLQIVAILNEVKSASAPFLMQQTGLTWGNLSSHITRLSKAEYLEVEKSFVDNKPQTMVALTRNGKSAFKAYKKEMRLLLGF